MARRKSGHSRFQCSDCHLSFSAKDILFNHWERLHSTTSLTVQCDKCGLSSRSKASLKEHIRRLHTLLEGRRCDECLADTWAGPRRSFVDHWLNLHRPAYSRWHRFGKHHWKTPKLCAKKVCDDCGSRQWNFVRHWRLLHGGRERLRCDECGLTAGLPLNLANHFLTQHSPHAEICICDQCSAQRRRENFAMHWKRMHSANRPKRAKRRCDDCGRVYKTALCLARHWSSLHSQQTLHACDRCSQAYSTRNRLVLHLDQEHAEFKDSEEKSLPASCDYCKVFLSEKSSVARHFRSHHNNFK